MPTRDPNDSKYRRLWYERYADDFLLGFIGPRKEAEEIKWQLGQFLQETLKLALSEEKTLITHASSESAKFLGYDISVMRDDKVRNRKGNRNLNGHIVLRVPHEVVQSKCKPYMTGGKAIHRAAALHDNAFSILAYYQSRYRGVVQYYQLASNLRDLGKLKWIMEISLTKTLARKFKTSVRQVYKRFRTTIETPNGPRKGLQVKVERANKRPLLAIWGGICLIRNMKATLDDNPRFVWNDRRTELIERLLVDTCELCGSHDRVAVHHVRALRDLQQWGRDPRPFWVERMAARQRKTLVVCHTCHRHIHRDGTAGNVAARRRRHGLLESRVR